MVKESGVGVYSAAGKLSREPREAPGRPGSGVQGGCGCLSAAASLTLEKAGNTEALNFCPHTRVQRKLRGPPQINSYF